MNKTDYKLLTLNDTMEFVAATGSGHSYSYSYKWSGDQTYYAVFLNTLSKPISESLVISVDVSIGSS